MTREVDRSGRWAVTFGAALVAFAMVVTQGCDSRASLINPGPTVLVDTTDAPERTDALVGDEYFTRVREISLDDSFNVGVIGFLDRSEDGLLVVTDPRANDVFIFGSEGQALHKLSPRPCTGSDYWLPVNARFVPGGGVFVISNAVPGGSGRWGFVFDSRFNCVQEADETFKTTESLVLQSANEQIGLFERATPEGHVVELHVNDGVGQAQTRRTLDGAFNEFGHLNYRLAGGGVAVFGETILAAFPTEPDIFLYSRRGRLLGVSRISPVFFPRYERDLSPWQGAESSAEIRSLTSGRGWTTGFSQLTDALAYVQYRDMTSGSWWGMLVDATGVPVDSKLIPMSGPAILAKHARLYFRTRAAVGPEGMVSNPGLVEYAMTQ